MAGGGGYISWDVFWEGRKQAAEADGGTAALDWVGGERGCLGGCAGRLKAFVCIRCASLIHSMLHLHV